MSKLPATLSEFRAKDEKPLHTKITGNLFGHFEEEPSYRDHEERWAREIEQKGKNDEDNKKNQEWRRSMTSDQPDNKKPKMMSMSMSKKAKGRASSNEGPVLNSKGGKSKKQKKGGKRPRKTIKRRR